MTSPVPSLPRASLLGLLCSLFLVQAGQTSEPATGPDATTERSVLRAQVLLERAHFSPGEIDGESGGNFVRALAGFQRSRGLADDGLLGPETWAELERDSVPTLVEYAVVEDDLDGPFQPLPEDIAERAALPALGYETLAEALAERFHASPALLRRLNPEASLERAGELLLVPNVLDLPALPAPASLLVTEATGTLALLDADGEVLAQFPASMGSERDPLPIGDWTVTTVAVDPVFHYNPELFWDAEPDAERATLQPGPNNPVGAVWIGISKPHYGIHGTPEPAQVGKTASNGCIRLTNWSARRLAQVARTGMPVTMRP